MKKIKDLFLRHKILSVMSLISLVIIIILLYFFLSIFVSNNNSYGNRLNGIDKVTISKKELKDISKTLSDKSEVSEASVRIQGKIIYFNIVFVNDISLDTAKSVAYSTLENFDEKEKKFYDFGYFLTQSGSKDEENSGFKITGYMHAGQNEITYIKG